jgi:hypothetical protein
MDEILCCTWAVYATGWAFTILCVLSPWHYISWLHIEFSITHKTLWKKSLLVLLTLSFLYLYILPSFLSCCLPIPFTCESYYDSSPPSFFPSLLSPDIKTSILSFIYLFPMFISFPPFSCIPFPSLLFADTIDYLSPYSLAMAEHG